jgi:hypothetical protein
MEMHQICVATFSSNSIRLRTFRERANDHSTKAGKTVAC